MYLLKSTLQLKTRNRTFHTQYTNRKHIPFYSLPKSIVFTPNIFKVPLPQSFPLSALSKTPYKVLRPISGTYNLTITVCNLDGNELVISDTTFSVVDVNIFSGKKRRQMLNKEICSATKINRKNDFLISPTETAKIEFINKFNFLQSQYTFLQ